MKKFLILINIYFIIATTYYYNEMNYLYWPEVVKAADKYTFYFLGSIILIIINGTLYYKTNIKKCTYCQKWINKKAIKCPHCQSEIK